MSRYEIAARYRRRITEIEDRLSIFYAKKQKLEQNIAQVNAAYKEGRLAPQSYFSYIKSKALTHWLVHYESSIYRLHEQAQEYRSRLENLRKPRRTDKGFAALMVLLILGAAMGGFLLSTQPSITGYAAVNETAVESEVVIQNYYAIIMSPNMADGIQFDPVTIPGIDDVNATDNYNGPSQNTSLWINLSSDSNVNVNFSVMSDNALILEVGTYSINQSNISWSDSTTNNATVPAGPSGSRPLNNTYVNGTGDVIPGGQNFYRIWVDIPVDAKPGAYNNTIEFRVVVA